MRTLLAVALVVSAAAAPAGATPPPFDALRVGLRPSSVVLLDRDGAPIGEAFRPDQGLRLEWTPLRSLPQEMLHVLLVAEDRRFFEHSGVDWRAFVAALWQNLWYRNKRGASTLTMQLAGLLDPALRPTAGHGGRRTIGQKFDQTVAARDLEAHWSKEQILEAYLNLAYFRGRLQGIAAAAWGLFGKPPAQLTRPEAALLSALLRGPNARPGLVLRRACELLRRIGDGGACDALAALAPALERHPLEPRWSLAAELAAEIPGGGGQRIATTLDRAWQGTARRLAANGGTAWAAEVAVLGEDATVLAYASSLAGGGARARAVEAGALSLPLALGQALDGGRLTAASLLLASEPVADEPARWVSVRTALVSTPDLIAARVDDPAGALVEPDAAGASEALPLLELAARYAVLAGDGRWRAPRWRAGTSVAAGPVMSRSAAFVTRELLPTRDPDGCRRYLMDVSTEAVTLVGLVGRLVVALRVTGDGAESQALALFDALADAPAARAACAARREVPAGVVRQMVSFDPPVESPRSEWFLRGTELAVSQAPLEVARIAWPLPRSIVDGRAAITDPAFRVFFEARPPLARLHWRLNGISLGVGPRVAWAPRAGLYRLELQTPEGVPVDQIEFAARGPL